MSLVLLAILVVIWASILVPLLRRDRGNWPGGRRPARGAGSAFAAGGGRAVWRPETEPLETVVSVLDWTAVHPSAGDGARLPPPWAQDDAVEPASAGPRTAGRRDASAARTRRAVFRRRQVLVVLLLVAAATAVPWLLLGGAWLVLEAVASLLLAAYLLALVLLARRRHRHARPVPARVAARPLAAVPAAPE